MKKLFSIVTAVLVAFGVFMTPTPIFAAVTAPQQADRNWYATDRDHVAQLVQQAQMGGTVREILKDEYQTLAQKLSETQKQAYVGKRGYILYSPALTDEVNALWVATEARALLMTDISKGTIRSIDVYYPKAFEYRFLSYQNQTMYRYYNGYMLRSYVRPQVTPEAYLGYNQAAIAAALDNLPISDFYLKGQAIYFVNGQLNYAPILGLNDSYAPRGNYDGRITLFSRNNTVEKSIQTLAHELGHNIGYEVFHTYSAYSFTWNRDNYTTLGSYAKIYGQSAPVTPTWGDNLNENFAEDFANLMVGKPKTTNWTGNHTAEVNQFLSQRLSDLKGEQTAAPSIQRVKIGLGTYQLEWMNPFYMNGDDVYLAKANKIQLTLVNPTPLPSGKSYYARLEGNGLYKSVAFVNGVAELDLPADKAYTVRIGAGTSPYYAEYGMAKFMVVRAL